MCAYLNYADNNNSKLIAMFGRHNEILYEYNIAFSERHVQSTSAGSP